MEGVTFEYKYGSMKQLLAGDGKVVLNFEELHRSPVRRGLVTPYFIGIFQNGLEMLPPAMEEIYSALFQSGFVFKHGSEDTAHPDLISVVYDHNMWTDDIIRIMLRGDVSRRIKLRGHNSTPQFDTKYAPSFRENLENRRIIGEGGPAGMKILDDTCAVMESARDEFGLTRTEAAFYMLFKMQHDKEKGFPSLIAGPGEYEFRTNQADETQEGIRRLGGKDKK